MNNEELRNEFEKITKEYKNKINELIDKNKEDENEFKAGDEYYIINSDGNIIISIWDDNEFDHYRSMFGNVFKTEKEAEDKLKELKIVTKVNKWIKKHDKVKLNWNDESQVKWYIYYNYYYNELTSSNTYVCKSEPFHFSSINLVEQCINEFEDDLKWLFTHNDNK